MMYNKFLIELFKFYYLYSIYDYYIYYNNHLLETMVANEKKKNKIFNDICMEIKTTCNIPNNILHYPPFIENTIDDINSIMNYSYEQPNYFKFIDFMNAIIYVFDIKKYNNNFEDIFTKCIKCTKQQSKNEIKMNNNLKKNINEKPIIQKININTYEEISLIEK